MPALIKNTKILVALAIIVFFAVGASVDTAAYKLSKNFYYAYVDIKNILILAISVIITSAFCCIFGSEKGIKNKEFFDCIILCIGFTLFALPMWGIWFIFDVFGFGDIGLMVVLISSFGLPLVITEFRSRVRAKINRPD